MKNIQTLILFAIILLSQSCYKDVGPIEDNEQTTPNQGVSFAQQVQPIFDSQCANCHGNSGNLNLAANVSYDNLVNVNASGYSGKRVVPNDAENSILYKKTDGSNAFGNNMPLGRNLSASQINTIKQWINEGAQNN